MKKILAASLAICALQAMAQYERSPEIEAEYQIFRALERADYPELTSEAVARVVDLDYKQVQWTSSRVRELVLAGKSYQEVLDLVKKEAKSKPWLT